MKVLSLLQPWASLCIHTDSNGKALKQIETRSWNTKHRGRLLIHASKSKKGRKVFEEFKTSGYLRGTIFQDMKFDDLPFGAIIGETEIVHVCTTETISASPVGSSCGQKWDIYAAGSYEYMFGDYSPNRYGWLLSNPILFREPIPCKGQLSIWNLPAELEPLVNRQIELCKY